MNETWREKNLYIKKKRYTLKLISLYIYLNQEIIEIKQKKNIMKEKDQNFYLTVQEKVEEKIQKILMKR